jgi:hypothetical protein
MGDPVDERRSSVGPPLKREAEWMNVRPTEYKRLDPNPLILANPH